MFDALACEPQFLDHLAPVWRAVPASARGQFLVDASLLGRAKDRGIDAVSLDAHAVRTTALPMTRKPQGRRALVASYGDTKVARRLGYGEFAFLEHGIAQTYLGYHNRHGSYSGGVDRDDTSLFMVPNDRAADLWRSAYPSADVVTVGSPHLDTLPQRSISPLEQEPVVAVSFHWPAQAIAPEAGTAYGHFLPALPALAKAYKVIGHAHPKGDWQARMSARFREAGIEFVPDFHDVLRRADLYICDNSSTLYEFASTGRPVLVLNTPMYRRNVEHGLRFWEAAKVGINCDHPDDLVRLAGEALADDAHAQRDREAALDIVYAHRSGAAARAAAALVQWAQQEAAVAA